MQAMTFALATTLLLGGCTNISELSDQILDESKQLWAAQGPPSYTLILLRGCTCLGPQTAITVEVRNRAVVSRSYSDGTPLEPQWASQYPDVPGLFAFIDLTRAQQVYSWGAEYHPVYGYPTAIRVNYDPGTTADDFAYVVNDMIPVP